MTPPTRRSPPLAYVRAFEAAARHLSFTKAAQELGFTQAAISTQVRALEQLVGRPLFTRNARSLTLTESGESYLPTLRQALNQIDDATDAIATLGARGLGVTITVASLAQKYVARGLVVVPLDARPRSPWAYYLRLSGPRHGAAAQAMLAAVRAEAALMA